jgi:hypothetical protein
MRKKMFALYLDQTKVRPTLNSNISKTRHPTPHTLKPKP